jgi:hypothetical protein
MDGTEEIRADIFDGPTDKEGVHFHIRKGPHQHPTRHEGESYTQAIVREAFESRELQGLATPELQAALVEKATLLCGLPS